MHLACRRRLLMQSKSLSWLEIAVSMFPGLRSTIHCVELIQWVWCSDTQNHHHISHACTSSRVSSSKREGDPHLNRPVNRWLAARLWTGNPLRKTASRCRSRKWLVHLPKYLCQGWGGCILKPRLLQKCPATKAHYKGQRPPHASSPDASGKKFQPKNGSPPRGRELVISN